MRPVINPIYPIEDVASVDELMAIAVGMEREAAERYEQLAAEMETRGDSELAELFHRLAALERDHESGIGRWAERQGLKHPVAATFAWRMPETFDDEDAYSLTPYRALSIAVRNEERAFAFYTYLSAMAPDDTVRARAEALAREELNHVGQLRMLRRRAFHMERQPPRAARRARTLDELRTLAAGFAAASAQVDEAAAIVLAQAGEGEAATLVRRLAGPSGTAAAPGSNAAEGALAAGLLEPGALTTEGALRLALRDADEVTDAYMAAAEQAGDEEVMRQAQALAEQALGRAAVLRTLIDERERRRQA